MKDIAIYCTSNDAFIIPSIIALESIKRFHPKSSYFIIANKDKISAENICLLTRFGIDLIHFSEDKFFSPSGKWPSEAFWQLKGPSIFYDLNFTYSMSVDGDTLCVQPLDLVRLLPQIKGYAGIENYAARQGNFLEPEFVRLKYKLDDKDMNGHNTNTGVIFWNNKKMFELQLWERSLKVYQECTKENPKMFIAVDQSLFALVSILEPSLPWLVIPSGYNYRMRRDDVRREGVAEESIRIYHFTGRKPWQSISLREKITNPSLLIHRDKHFTFLNEQGVFNRNLTIRSQRLSERIVMGVRYLFDDWITSFYLKSPLVNHSLKIIPFVRKVKMLLGLVKK